MSDNRKLNGTYAVLTHGFKQAHMVNRRYAKPPSDFAFETVVYTRPEAPVIAGYMPSEVFPGALGSPKDAFPTGNESVPLEPPPVPNTNGSTPRSGYRPMAALFAVQYDGKGGISGHGRVTIGQGSSGQYGEDFDVTIVNLLHESSYAVRDDGFSVDVTIRYVFNLQKLIDNDLFVNGAFVADDTDPMILPEKTRKTVLVTTLTYFFLLAEGGHQIPFIVTGSAPSLVVQSGVQWRIKA
jgi:hypothetical protein